MSTPSLWASASTAATLCASCPQGMQVRLLGLQRPLPASRVPACCHMPMPVSQAGTLPLDSMARLLLSSCPAPQPATCDGAGTTQPPRAFACSSQALPRLRSSRPHPQVRHWLASFAVLRRRAGLHSITPLAAHCMPSSAALPCIMEPLSAPLLPQVLLAMRRSCCGCWTHLPSPPFCWEVRWGGAEVPLQSTAAGLQQRPRAVWQAAACLAL